MRSCVVGSGGGRVVRAAVAGVMATSLLAVTGCTLVRLAYDNADRMLLARFERFVNLDDEQRERVAVALNERLDRHRRLELPKLATTLRTASDAVKRGFGPQQVDAVAADAEHIARELVTQSLPVLGIALSGLSQGQLDFLQRRQDESLEEYRKVYAVRAPKEARLHNRALRAVELVEQWTGPLRPEQASLVHTVRDAMPDGAGAWADYREDRHRQLLANLRAGASAAAVETYLSAWLLDLDAAPQAVTQMRPGITAGLKRMVIEVGATLDDEQRKHLADRLDGFAEDAEALSAKSDNRS